MGLGFCVIQRDLWEIVVVTQSFTEETQSFTKSVLREFEGENSAILNVIKRICENLRNLCLMRKYYPFRILLKVSWVIPKYEAICPKGT